MDYKQEIINSIKSQETLEAWLMYGKLTKSLREDQDIALSAISTNLLSISHLPKKLRNDKEFLKKVANEISKAA